MYCYNYYVRNSILIGLVGLLLGLGIGYFVVQQIPLLTSKETVNKITELSASVGLKQNKIIGFLPYWLLSSSKNDYSPYITTLTYFGLTLNPDGTVKKFDNPGESEPGWHALNSGKIDNKLQIAKNKGVDLSLLVFSGNEENIYGLLSDPKTSADNMMQEVAPIMKQYGFTDLNLDIESVKEASPEARAKFTTFVKQVKKHVDEKKLGTITIDVSPTALLRPYLINVNDVHELADYIVFMTYDYHFMGSYVTGPVSPVGGMGNEAEFDSETAIKLAKQIMPEYKIIVGMPSYGYGWETIQTNPRSATIPGSGYVISNRKVEELLKDCSDCIITWDANAQESYLTYTDAETGTFKQIFYPDEKATQAKIDLVQKYHVGGLAVWALGYEGESLMDPLKKYK